MRNYRLKFNRRLLLVFSLGLIVLGVIAAMAFVQMGEDPIGALCLSGSGTSYALMAAVGNIDRVSDKETSGYQISARLWLIDVDGQVDDTVPFPRANAAGEVGTIPLRTGEFMHYFDVIDDTISDSSKGEKGEITTVVTNTIEFTVGGFRRNIQRFMEDHPGGRFLIIYQMNDDESYYIIGTALKPMLFKSFERLNKDSRSVKMTFENKSFQQPQKYIGSIVRDEPAVLEADAAVLTVLSNKNQYTTGANTAETKLTGVAGLAEADETRIIEIIGSGGAYPTIIEDGANFVLKNAATWTGNAGSRISFRVLDKDTLVEASRIQTA